MAQSLRQFGFKVGRQFLGTVPFVASQRQELAVQNGIPKDYFLAGLLLNLKFRLGITGGTTNGTVLAEAPQNLIEMVEVSGNHKVIGDYTPYKLQGSHSYQLTNIMESFQHLRNTASLAGAVANYDMQVLYMIPFIPLGSLDKRERLFFLLDPPNWNTLQLYIYWGATTSLISGGDRTLALSAFGSATGTPLLNVHRLLVKLSANRSALRTIPLKRSYKSIKIETTQTASYIADLNRGNFINRFYFVTGTRATGGSLATQGDAFLTLSNALLTRFQIKRDDVSQRDTIWEDNQDYEGQIKQLSSGFFGATGAAFPQGYNITDFIEHGSAITAYDSRTLALNNLRFELWGDITGATDQRLHVITEEIASIPVLQ